MKNKKKLKNVVSNFSRYMIAATKTKIKLREEIQKLQKSYFIHEKKIEIFKLIMLDYEEKNSKLKKENSELSKQREHDISFIVKKGREIENLNHEISIKTKINLLGDKLINFYEKNRWKPWRKSI